MILFGFNITGYSCQSLLVEGWHFLVVLLSVSWELFDGSKRILTHKQSLILHLKSALFFRVKPIESLLFT